MVSIDFGRSLICFPCSCFHYILLMFHYTFFFVSCSFSFTRVTHKSSCFVCSAHPFVSVEIRDTRISINISMHSLSLSPVFLMCPVMSVDTQIRDVSFSPALIALPALRNEEGNSCVYFFFLRPFLPPFKKTVAVVVEDVLAFWLLCERKFFLQ